jgi:altronate hydrolase
MLLRINIKAYTHQLIEAYKEGKIYIVDIFSVPKHTNGNRPFKNVDGIKFLNHQGGCGGTRQDAGYLENY